MKYKIAVCGACGTAFTTPPPDAAELSSLYEGEYDYRWFQENYPAKSRDARLRLKEWRGHLGSRLLDFGGGMGYFAQAAQDQGLEAVTYDPYADTSSESSANPTGEFDTVVMVHVLEHSPQPYEVLAEVRDYLCPQGKVIACVPNFNSSGYRRHSWGWTWAQPPIVHTVHFTREGMERLFERAGFEIVEVSFHDRWDANWLADVQLRQFFRGFNWLRRGPVFNKSARLRKGLARVSSTLRLASLALSRAIRIQSAHRAELQLVARGCKPSP